MRFFLWFLVVLLGFLGLVGFGVFRGFQKGFRPRAHEPLQVLKFAEDAGVPLYSYSAEDPSLSGPLFKRVRQREVLLRGRSSSTPFRAVPEVVAREWQIEVPRRFVVQSRAQNYACCAPWLRTFRVRMECRGVNPKARLKSERSVFRSSKSSVQPGAIAEETNEKRR